jgi:UDP-hydrolysing UDP-N-acetyl-D-glucosamine 2-epimerase
MSHLHFVAMQEHADRLLRMGEESWRICVTGDPALDVLNEMRPVSREELAKSLGIELKPPLLVITFHPTTLGTATAAQEVSALLSALQPVGGTLIFTMPNADSEWKTIMTQLTDFAAHHPSAQLYPSLGQLRYYSLLKHADVMVGNSSSGIWESPSFKIPAVNIGDRQRGRFRARNIIDVPCDSEKIHAGIARALSPQFRSSLAGLVNPFGDGGAARRIVDVLKRDFDPRSLLAKTSPV